MYTNKLLPKVGVTFMFVLVKRFRTIHFVAIIFALLCLVTPVEGGNTRWRRCWVMRIATFELELGAVDTCKPSHYCSSDKAINLILVCCTHDKLHLARENLSYKCSD